MTRVFEHFWLRYRRTWRATATASFIEPLIYLGALGIGLGRYVDSQGGAEALDGLKYLWFIAPGLLASLAVQVGAVESTWPVFGAFKWDRTYLGMAATPLRPIDIMLGHLSWMAARMTTAVVAFSVAMALFGAWRSPWAPLGVGSAILGGVAFAAPLAAYAATKRQEGGFVGVHRFLVIPMFLFAGTFYPVEQLPDGVEWLAWLTPLFHSVELTRSFSLGELDARTPIHALYLVTLLSVGMAAGVASYTRKLAT